MHTGIHADNYVHDFVHFCTHLHTPPCQHNLQNISPQPCIHANIAFDYTTNMIWTWSGADSVRKSKPCAPFQMRRRNLPQSFTEVTHGYLHHKGDRWQFLPGGLHRWPSPGRIPTPPECPHQDRCHCPQTPPVHHTIAPSASQTICISHIVG